MRNLIKPVIDECIFSLIQRLSVDDMTLADLAMMDLDSVGFMVLESMIEKGVVYPEDSEEFLHEYYETLLKQAQIILDFSEANR
tara:strand:+ start:20264 stop:20515 length:252 start_codon:yes stop_codon:yes gene_type:complete